MGSLEVFQCNFNRSMKSFISAKNSEKLFLQVDTGRHLVSGKGYICNEEGKNEYVAEFDIPAKEIREVNKDLFQGQDALVVVTKLATLYGAKKSKTILPAIKDIDRAIDIVTKVAKEAGGLGADTAPQAPTAQAANTLTPRPVQNGTPAPVPAPSPAAPVPAPQKAPAPAPAPSPTAPALVPNPAANSKSQEEDAKAKAENYEKKLQKLDIMHESGMISDSEYKEKKLKLLCDEKGLAPFFIKIQKLFALKKVLSDSEFEVNKNKILDECFDTSVTDLNVFKDNMSKLPIILMSELLDEDEYQLRLDDVITSVAYDEDDSDDVFCLKLQKFPILVECELVNKAKFESDIEQLKDMLNPTVSDSIETLSSKLSRWPAMVKAGAVSEADFKKKQERLKSDIMAMPAGDEASFKAKVERIIKLRDANWIIDMKYTELRMNILKDVGAISDYILRTKLYNVAMTCGLISAEDYAAKKQELIKEIFAPYSSMEEFQKKVNMLMKLHEAEIISGEEYDGYKNKLMSDL